MGKDEMKK